MARNGMAMGLASLDRLRVGDEAAFAALVEEFQPRITTYLLRMVGDLDTAKDLSQDTFLRAFRALPKIDEQPNLSGWLFTIATNCALDTLRRRKLLSWLPLRHHHSAETTHDSDEGYAEAELVRQALRMLKDGERAALLLRLHYGFSYKEAGQILGLSEAGFRQRLHRARLAFKRVYMELERGGQRE